MTGSSNTVASIAIRLLITVFFVLTSAYFFLAYIPYTNFFLIQAPPYPWLAHFAKFHSYLYWAVLALSFFEFASRRRERLVRVALAMLVVIGLWLTIGNVLLEAGSDWKSYAWSVAILVPLTLLQIAGFKGDSTSTSADGEPASFSYVNAMIAAALLALFSAAGVAVRTYNDAHQYKFGRAEIDLLLWMVAAHLCVAIVAISALNVILLVAVKATCKGEIRNIAIRRWVSFGAGLLLLSIYFSYYLGQCLSLTGMRLLGYSIPFSIALSCAAASIVWSVLDAYGTFVARRRYFAAALLLLVVAAFAVSAVFVPTWIGGADWNSFLQYSFNTIFWLVAAVGVYVVRPSSLAWAKSLGSTTGEVQDSINESVTQNSAFAMVYGTLHPNRVERCGGFCRILRQCTNMRDTVARRDLNLVSQLTASEGAHPNIFIIVVDSMRPDYIGAYNAKVDFTPNIDQFARESVVMRNAFTSYAGTSLSEPSIFAGALLLHSHYPKPFSRENSLLKLAVADRYRLLVSYDPILRQVLDASDPSEKLDREKAWNEVELGDSYRQLQPYLDEQAKDGRPIFFYSQPQNVHQGTANRLEDMEHEHWAARPGFQKVTTYRMHDLDRIFGAMIADLKHRGIYDNSIIVLTSDHGDGSAGTVCHGHNLEICPDVIRVPLIIHLPPAMRQEVVFDDRRVATPSDVMPSLYYLLGHRPVEHHLIMGRPMFTKTQEELESYKRQDVFFVSDARPAYGLLMDNARYLYFVYDSPQQSYYYDLSVDPEGRHNIITPEITARCNQRLIEYLFAIGNFYGYPPTGGRDGL